MKSYKRTPTLIGAALLSGGIFASISAYFYIDSKIRLSRVYGEIARNHVATSDLREAYSSLHPSLSNGFEVVAIFSHNGVLVGALPNNSMLPRFSKIQSVEYPLSTVPESNHADLGKIVFYYPIWPLITLILAVWILGTSLILWAMKSRIKKLKEEHDQATRLQISQAEVAMARQVSHDIQSPLLALKIFLSKDEIKSLPYSPQVSSALGRFEEITRDLLMRSRVLEDSALDLSELLSKLVEEKRFELATVHPDLKIELDCEPNLITNLQLPRIDLTRILSNLVNNSAQAMTASLGKRIQISATWNQFKEVVIRICDEGPGIDPAIVRKLGLEKFSTKNGNGLGLYHAFNTLSRYRCDILIENRTGQLGTQVTLVLRPRPNL